MLGLQRTGLVDLGLQARRLPETIHLRTFGLAEESPVSLRLLRESRAGRGAGQAKITMLSVGICPCLRVPILV